MKHKKRDIKKPIIELVHEFEVLSQKGTVLNFEKTVLCDIAEYYEQEAHFEKALSTIDYALQAFGLSIDLITRKINLLIKNSKGVDAIEYLDFTPQPDKSEPRIKLLRAKVLVSLKKFEEAFPILEELKFEESFSSDTLSDVYLCLASIFERLHRFEEMYYALKDAILIYPKNNEALIRMWLCVEINKKFEDSLSLHKSLLEEEPFSYLAWFNLGHAYYYKRNYKKAIEAFEYSYIINPDFELAYRDCAEVCMDINDYKKALDCYTELKNRVGEDSEIYLNMGICFEKLQNVEKAKALYFKALSLDAHDDEVYYHLAECFFQQKKYPQAIHYIRKAIDLEDRQEEYHALLAKAYAFTGKDQEAIEAFEQATEVAPEMPVFWVQYASYYQTRGKYQKALEVLKMAEVHAVGAEIYYCMAVCYFNMDKRSKALKAMENGLIDNFPMHKLVYKFDKSLKDNKDVKAIIRYYAGEQ